MYLEDGLHRAVRAALRNRTVLHARVFDMDGRWPSRSRRRTSRAPEPAPGAYADVPARAERTAVASRGAGPRTDA